MAAVTGLPPGRMLPGVHTFTIQHESSGREAFSVRIVGVGGANRAEAELHSVPDELRTLCRFKIVESGDYSVEVKRTVHPPPPPSSHPSTSRRTVQQEGGKGRADPNKIDPKIAQSNARQSKGGGSGGLRTARVPGGGGGGGGGGMVPSKSSGKTYGGTVRRSVSSSRVRPARAVKEVVPVSQSRVSEPVQIRRGGGAVSVSHSQSVKLADSSSSSSNPTIVSVFKLHVHPPPPPPISASLSSFRLSRLRGDGEMQQQQQQQQLPQGTTFNVQAGEPFRVCIAARDVNNNRPRGGFRAAAASVRLLIDGEEGVDLVKLDPVLINKNGTACQRSAALPQQQQQQQRQHTDSDDDSSHPQPTVRVVSEGSHADQTPFHEHHQPAPAPGLDVIFELCIYEAALYTLVVSVATDSVAGQHADFTEIGHPSSSSSPCTIYCNPSVKRCRGHVNKSLRFCCPADGMLVQSAAGGARVFADFAACSRRMISLPLLCRDEYNNPISVSFHDVAAFVQQSEQNSAFGARHDVCDVRILNGGVELVWFDQEDDRSLNTLMATSKSKSSKGSGSFLGKPGRYAFTVTVFGQAVCGCDGLPGLYVCVRPARPRSPEKYPRVVVTGEDLSPVRLFTEREKRGPAAEAQRPPAFQRPVARPVSPRPWRSPSPSRKRAVAKVGARTPAATIVEPEVPATITPAAAAKSVAKVKRTKTPPARPTELGSSKSSDSFIAQKAMASLAETSNLPSIHLTLIEMRPSAGGQVVRNSPSLRCLSGQKMIISIQLHDSRGGLKSSPFDPAACRLIAVICRHGDGKPASGGETSLVDLENGKLEIIATMPRRMGRFLLQVKLQHNDFRLCWMNQSPAGSAHSEGLEFECNPGRVMAASTAVEFSPELKQSWPNLHMVAGATQQFSVILKDKWGNNRCPGDSAERSFPVLEQHIPVVSFKPDITNDVVIHTELDASEGFYRVSYSIIRAGMYQLQCMVEGKEVLMSERVTSRVRPTSVVPVTLTVLPSPTACALQCVIHGGHGWYDHANLDAAALAAASGQVRSFTVVQRDSYGNRLQRHHILGITMDARLLPSDGTLPAAEIDDFTFAYHVEEELQSQQSSVKKADKVRSAPTCFLVVDYSITLRAGAGQSVLPTKCGLSVQMCSGISADPAPLDDLSAGLDDLADFDTADLASDFPVWKSELSIQMGVIPHHGHTEATGDGLLLAYVGQPAQFTIVARDSAGNTCSVAPAEPTVRAAAASRSVFSVFEIFLSGPDCGPGMQVADQGNGAAVCSFDIRGGGIFHVTIKVAGEHIVGSPYRVLGKASKDRRSAGGPGTDRKRLYY